MTTMNVSLPDEMKAFIEAQMAAEGYASASEFLRSLIREEQRRKAKRELELRLLEGLQGPATVLDGEEWDAIEREAQQRYAAEQTGR